jgi:hypothetical protein
MKKENREQLLQVYASLSLYALDLAEADVSKSRCEEIGELLRHYL